MRYGRGWKSVLGFILLLWAALQCGAQSSWVRVTDVPKLDVYDVEALDGTIYAGTADRVYTGLNNGERWVASASLGNIGFVSSIKVFHGKLYAGTFRAGVSRSSNGGASWESVSNGISSINSVSHLLIWNNELYAASYGEGVFKFDEAAGKWNSFSNGLPQSVDGNVYDLINSGPAMVAAAGANGDFYRYNQTQNSWDALFYNSRGLQPGLQINTLLADGNSILAGVFGSNRYGLLRSDDGGNSWHTDTVGMGKLFNIHIPLAGLDFLAQGATKNYAVVNTFAGVNGSNASFIFERARDAATGTRWDSLVAFTNNSFVYAMAEGGGKLYAALDSGLYYKQVGPGSGINTPPGGAVIVYPNPTIGQASIRFNPIVEQKISISVFDMEGRLLAIPYSNYLLTPGPQSLPVDLSRYPAAGYVINILYPHGSQSLRLIKDR